jgi:hypothetical protein
MRLQRTFNLIQTILLQKSLLSICSTSSDITLAVAKNYGQRLQISSVILVIFALKTSPRPGVVIHICNLSYSGGRDQEDNDSKPAWAKVSKTAS